MAVTDVSARLLTADDLLRLYSQGVRGELIRGVLCETLPAGQEHGEIVVNLATELRNFVKPRRLGRLMGSDSGVWLERDPDTVREPDIAYFTVETSPLDERVTGYAEAAPDLVVEIWSPDDGRWSLNDKALMWLSYGVRLVWVVYPDRRMVDVYRRNRRAARLSDADTLNGLDVLPGFTCQVRTVFDP